jgi:hypothetical protein
MRKIALTLVVLMLAASASEGTVSLTMSSWGDEITIHYDAGGEPNLVRAFALNISADNDTNIVAILDDAENAAYYQWQPYNIYPGQVVIEVNATSGKAEIVDQGSPAADPCEYPGTGTLPGLGTDGITIEMGSLYEKGEESPPAAAGNLVTFVVNNDCNITVTVNTARGGVVLENGSSTSISVSAPYKHVGCLPKGHADYSEWELAGKKVGRPACWCFGAQCHGDADGKLGGSTKTGLYRVGPIDLTIFSNFYYSDANNLEPDFGSGVGAAGLCADFAHDMGGSTKTGLYRVGPTDLTIFGNYYYSNADNLELPFGSGVPKDCGGTLLPKGGE